MRSFGKNIAVSLVAIVITLVLCEVVFRWMLFGNGVAMSHLRQPGLYVKNYPDPSGLIFSEDYWRLYTLLGGAERPPEHPDPLVGWSGSFLPGSLRHFNDDKIGKRRPVLLFGDSFAQCVKATCFEEVLNSDSVFAQEHYFLNYGVGGYGLDQISLLAEQVVPRYEDPVVILSMMTRDMERSMFASRVGQKPKYELENGALVLHNTPIDSVPDRWFADNKPAITSYLYRLLEHHLLGDTLCSDEETRVFWKGMEDLNKALLRKAVQDLQARKAQFLVVIFEPLYNYQVDRRSYFLRGVLEELHVPYLFTSDVMRADGYHGGSYARYEQLENGHPTELQNRLIANCIQRFTMDGAYAATLIAEGHQRWEHLRRAQEKNSVEDYMERISMDSTWFANVAGKARERNIPLDSMLRLDAAYIRDTERSKQP